MNSPLVQYTNISPNKTSPRNHRIDRITIHCFVGQCSVQSGVDAFKSRLKLASCNYVVAKDGKVGLCVEEKDRSWCSSNAANDHRAITIEVASDTKAPYAVTDAALNALVALVTDICKRNGIKKVMWIPDKDTALRTEPAQDEAVFTLHKWFKNKECPGEYLISRHVYIADCVNYALSGPVVSDSALNSDFKPFIVKIIADSLNIRKEPNAKAEIRGVLKKGEKYTIVDSSGTWGKLKSGIGWINISSKYVAKM